MNPEVQTAIKDLVEAIQNVTLGSVEYVVVTGAVVALIHSWNDHNEDDIDTLETIAWAQEYIDATLCDTKEQLQ